MAKNYNTNLLVNDEEIDLTQFPEEFLTNVVIAAVSSLKDVDDIETLELYEDEGKTKIVVNGEKVTLATFPNDYITNTVNGLLSTLRGVDTIKTVKIDIKAQR